MQLLKNKKFIIACIAIAVIVLIAIVVANVSHKKEKKEKKYTGGEMTLVDTIGKDSGHAAEVYITKDQDIMLSIEDAMYGNFSMNEIKAPVTDTIVKKVPMDRKIEFLIEIRTNNVDSDAETEEKYPCDCELVVSSNILGIEYNISISVDKEVVYKKGSMTQKEVDETKIFGYTEYIEKHGKLGLPENAILLNITNDSRFYGADGEKERLDVEVCQYTLDGERREIEVLDAANQDIVKKSFENADVKLLTVNDVEVGIFTERGVYFAYYTIGDATYINSAFYVQEEGTADDATLAEALKPYIVK